MNILRLVTYDTSIKLTPSQLEKCNSRNDNECFAYIHPSAIGVTTCGTRIHTQNVFTQKKSEFVKMVIPKYSTSAEVHGEIDNQLVVALVSKELLTQQQLFANCKRVEKQEDGTMVYMDCKHIKFMLKNEDIHLA